MTRLQQKPLIGLLLNPLGKHAKSLEYRDGQLDVSARRSRTIHLNGIAAAPVVTDRLLGSDLTIRCDDGHTTSLKGANRRSAIEFARTVETDWINHNTERFEASRSSIDAVLGAIAELGQPTKYPSACLVHPVVEQARHLNESLLARLPKASIGEHAQRQVGEVQGFIQNAGSMRNRAISAFEQQQLTTWEEFFDTFESNPLTPEQRIAIIADEDATLVLAGAGSGKTRQPTHKTRSTV